MSASRAPKEPTVLMTHLAVWNVRLVSFAMERPTPTDLPFSKNMEVKFAPKVTSVLSDLINLRNVPRVPTIRSRVSEMFLAVVCVSKTLSTKNTARRAANLAASLPLRLKDQASALAMARIGAIRLKMLHAAV